MTDEPIGEKGKAQRSRVSVSTDTVVLKKARTIPSSRCAMLAAILALILWLLSPYISGASRILWYIISALLAVLGIGSTVVYLKSQEDPNNSTSDPVPDEPPSS